MDNNANKYSNYQRRSFVYRKINSSEVTWSECNGFATASSIADQSKEIEYATHLALCDLSYLQRIGFKGAGTCEWLEQQNIQIPKNINESCSNTEGYLVARLGSNDILILDSIKNETNAPNKLEQNWHTTYSNNKTACGYIVPRQDSHACFSVSGNFAAEMFTKLCAIDLRTEKFANNTIAQTSLARLGVIIIRHDLNECINYLVLVESASAEYCWDCLLDAMQEFNGNVIGSSALIALLP